MTNPEFVQQEQKLTVETPQQLGVEETVVELDEPTDTTLKAYESEIDRDLAAVRQEVSGLQTINDSAESGLAAAREITGTSGDGIADEEQVATRIAELKQSEQSMLGSQTIVQEVIVSASSFGERIKLAKEKFMAILESVNERTLMEYMKAGGIDPDKIKDVPKGWKTKIAAIEKNQQPGWMLNPKFSFITKRDAAGMAFKILKERFA